MLSVEELTTGYGRAHVLHEVSLHVDAGEVVALVGSNGAGKTTLMRSLAGLHHPRGTRGGVTLDGADVTGAAAPRLVRRGMVLVPERRQLWPEHTVVDNLRLGAFSRRRDRSFVADRLAYCFALFPVLEQRHGQDAGTLSGGEQQMLAIARALMAEPRLLLLDEPSLGLAPLVVEKIFDVIGALRDEGLTILVVEQMVGMALAVADRGYVLERGHVALEGRAEDLLEDPGVRAAYLGVGVSMTVLEEELERS